MARHSLRRYLSRADFLHEIQHTVNPLFPGWSHGSSRLPALYEQALRAVTAALDLSTADRTLVSTPVELDEVNVEQIRQSLPDWSKDSLPTECLKDILRVLARRRLVEAPFPRSRFRTLRRLVVDHAAHKMTYWPQWDDLVHFWIQTTLTHKPCLTGDLHTQNACDEWHNQHHELACSAMFALLIDGGAVRDYRGRHFRFLDFTHIDVETGCLALPFSGYHTKRQHSQLRFRIPLGRLAQLFLNRYLLFLFKWKKKVGPPGSPIFPADYTARLESNFAHWLLALTRRESSRPAPPWALNGSPARTVKPISTTTISKFVYAARATLLETLPPFLVASLVGQLRYIPTTQASFQRVFPPNAPPLTDQVKPPNHPVASDISSPPPEIFQEHEESQDEKDLLSPAIANLSTAVESVIHAVRAHLRPLRKGLPVSRLLVIAKQIEQSILILHLLPCDIAESLDAPESNLRLFFEHVVDMLRGRKVTELGKLEPASISRYFTGMIDQILLCGESTNLLALRDANHVGTIVALSMREYSNQRTRKAIKTQWSAFFSYLNARDKRIPEVKRHDPRLCTTWDGHAYNLLTYDDLDRIIESIPQKEEPRAAIVYALVYTLAAYAGLRLHEICGIRIRDIIFTQDFLLLRIPVSKSRAGRRTILLDFLLHSDEREAFIRHLSARHKEVRHLPQWLDLPFLTLDDANSRLEEKSLGRKARSHLAMAPFKVTLHDLRHMFASWLLVRWYAARYGNPENLPAFAHRIFQDSCPNRLLQLFDHPSIETSDTTDKYHDPILYLIARLMGHAFPTTTVETYIHTFDFVHKLFLSSRAVTFPYLTTVLPLTQEHASNLLSCDDGTANTHIRQAAERGGGRYEPLGESCNPNNIWIAQRQRIADGGRKKR